MDQSMYFTAVEFLGLEADLLDDRRYGEWLQLLAPEIEYLVPVRRSLEGSLEDEFDDDSAWIRENYRSLEARVRRMSLPNAWTEQPRPLTRHFVSNVRVAAGGAEDTISVGSNLLLRRQVASGSEMFSGKRLDRWRRDVGTWRLVRREVRLDHTAVEARNLSIIF